MSLSGPPFWVSTQWEIWGRGFSLILVSEMMCKAFWHPYQESLLSDQQWHQQDFLMLLHFVDKKNCHVDISDWWSRSFLVDACIFRTVCLDSKHLCSPEAKHGGGSDKCPVLDGCISGSADCVADQLLTECKCHSLYWLLAQRSINIYRHSVDLKKKRKGKKKANFMSSEEKMCFVFENQKVSLAPVK